MKLELTADLRTKLMRARTAQFEELTSGRQCVPDDFFKSHEVVRLKCAMGHATYVGSDGQVTVWGFGEGYEPVVLENPKDIASVVVRWAKNVGLEELISLLPGKPRDGATCDFCGGKRVTSLRKLYSDAPDEEILCAKCHGLGWIDSSHQGGP